MQSPDAETAGAAFVALMALLGDGAAPGLGAGTSASGGPADVDSGLVGLTLDAHWGLPAALATAGTAQQARQAPCRLSCVPSDAQLLQALRENGFNPGGPPAGHPGAASGGRGARQQQPAAGPAGSGQGRGQEQALVLRLQAVKLVLHTTAAVCRYCRRVSTGRAQRSAAWPLFAGMPAYLCAGQPGTSACRPAASCGCMLRQLCSLDLGLPLRERHALL